MNEKSYSSKILNIAWEQYLPFVETTTGITLEKVNFDQSKQFFELHAKLFSERPSNFLAPEWSERKLNYYKEVVDHFFIKKEGRTIGYISGNFVDWDAYYLRFITILPEYRGTQISVPLVNYLVHVLEMHKVGRIETHTVPSNTRQNEKILGYGFVPTGQVLTDRWGAMSHWTKFNDKQGKEIFQRQFCT